MTIILKIYASLYLSISIYQFSNKSYLDCLMLAFGFMFFISINEYALFCETNKKEKNDIP